MIELVIKHCNQLGSTFGFGTFEGFTIYLGIITYAYLAVSKRGNKK